MTARRVAHDEELLRALSALPALPRHATRSNGRHVNCLVVFLLLVSLVSVACFSTLVVLGKFFKPVHVNVFYVLVLWMQWSPPSSFAAQAVIYSHFRFAVTHLRIISSRFVSSTFCFAASNFHEHFPRSRMRALSASGEAGQAGMIDALCRDTNNLHRYHQRFMATCGPLMLADASSCFVVGTFIFFFLSVTLELFFEFNVVRGTIVLCAYALVSGIFSRQLSLFSQGDWVAREMRKCRDTVKQARCSLQHALVVAICSAVVVVDAFVVVAVAVVAVAAVIVVLLLLLHT